MGDGRPESNWEWQEGEKSRVFLEPDRLRNAWTRDRAVYVEGDDAHHLARVLRLRPGDPVVAADGAGNEWAGRLEAVETDRGRTGGHPRCRVRLQLLERRPNRTEPPLDLVLIQGVPKGEKMDQIVQKGVEVGVSRIVPVVTRRTVPHFDERKAAERVRRWQRIAREAARQARRGRIPIVEPVQTWDGAVHIAATRLERGAAGFVAWEMEGRTSLKSAMATCAPKPELAYVCIGPEGGLVDEEVASAKGAGFRTVALGPRILRTETAGLVAMCAVLTEWGDLL